MNEGGIVCRYVFTTQVIKQAYRYFWRSSTRLWWLAGFFILVAILVEVSCFYSDPAQTTVPYGYSPTVYFLTMAFYNILPLIVVCGFFVFLIPFQMRRVFRKGPFFNQEMIYTFTESGINLESTLIQMHVKWAGFPRAIENKDGFMIFALGGRSFNWLPKSGFSSEEAIDAARDLLQQNVKKYRVMA